jgi:hypothetical protein
LRGGSVAFFQANDREAGGIPLKTGENAFQQPKSALTALEDLLWINGLKAISATSDNSGIFAALQRNSSG